MCSAFCAGASAGSASPCCLTIWWRKTAAWCSYSVKRTRSRSMPILFIPKNSNRLRASRCSGTSSLPTPSGGISDSARTAIAHGSHAACGVAALGLASHTPALLSHRIDILPESPVGSLFPSGRCCRPPRRQSLKPGPYGARLFSRTIFDRRLAKARNVIGQIKNLLITHGREHFGHGVIVAVPVVGLVLAHCLREIILALVYNVRDIVATGQIQIMAAIASILRDERRGTLHAISIARISRRVWRRQFRDEVGKISQIIVGE